VVPEPAAIRLRRDPSISFGFARSAGVNEDSRRRRYWIRRQAIAERFRDQRALLSPAAASETALSEGCDAERTATCFRRSINARGAYPFPVEDDTNLLALWQADDRPEAAL
jgi:hypothetical protein